MVLVAAAAAAAAAAEGEERPAVKAPLNCIPGRPLLHLTSGRADRVRHEQRGKCQSSQGSSPAASAHPVCFQHPIPTCRGRARAVQAMAKGPMAGALRQAHADQPLDVDEPCFGIRAGLTILAVHCIEHGCRSDIEPWRLLGCMCRLIAMPLQSNEPPMCSMHLLLPLATGTGSQCTCLAVMS